MQSGSLGFLAAFGAGLVSFLSPCVLPLIPGYISFITGMAPSELADSRRSSAAVLVPSLLFVAGFTIVFVALGATASVLGEFVGEYKSLLSKVAGVLVLVMGFFMLGVVKLPWLYGEKRFEMGRARSFGRAAALVMGMAFAFGWTPCVGPVLASILTLAGSTGDVGRGVALLLVYSAGLGVPFLLTGLLFGRLSGALRAMNRYSLIVNRVAGVILMVLGVLILSGRLTQVAGYLTRLLPFVPLG